MIYVWLFSKALFIESLRLVFSLCIFFVLSYLVWLLFSIDLKVSIDFIDNEASLILMLCFLCYLAHDLGNVLRVGFVFFFAFVLSCFIGSFGVGHRAYIVFAFLRCFCS